jgi:hypothetical protein
MKIATAKSAGQFRLAVHRGYVILHSVGKLGVGYNLLEFVIGNMHEERRAFVGASLLHDELVSAETLLDLGFHLISCAWK